jgi:hypothetical protein
MMIMCPPQHRQGRMDIDRLFRQVVIRRRRDSQKFACALEAGLARRSGEQAVVTDAVEPAWQKVEQEAADV